MVRRVWFERLADIFSWLLPTLTAAGMGIGWLYTIRNRDAEAAKVEAETDAIASTEWKKLYDEMAARCDRYDSRLAGIERENQEQKALILSLRHELDVTKMDLEVANMNIDYFIEYMKNHGLEVPELKFRGDDEV